MQSVKKCRIQTFRMRYGMGIVAMLGGKEFVRCVEQRIYKFNNFGALILSAVTDTKPLK